VATRWVTAKIATLKALTPAICVASSHGLPCLHVYLKVDVGNGNISAMLSFCHTLHGFPGEPRHPLLHPTAYPPPQDIITCPSVPSGRKKTITSSLCTLASRCLLLQSVVFPQLSLVHDFPDKHSSTPLTHGGLPDGPPAPALTLDSANVAGVAIFHSSFLCNRLNTDFKFRKRLPGHMLMTSRFLARGNDAPCHPGP